MNSETDRYFEDLNFRKIPLTPSLKLATDLNDNYIFNKYGLNMSSTEPDDA